MIYPSLRTWVSVHRSAFNRNIDAYNAIIAPQHCSIAVVIKSNGYGHGLQEMAQLCQQNNQVLYLCVVMLSEAVSLRLNHITKPILVLGMIDIDPSLAVEHNIDIAVYDVTTAQQLNAFAKKANKRCAIHLKIDTGLSRLGFLPHEALNVVSTLQQLSHIVIRGIYSHFAESNNEDLSFTQQQLQQFKSVLQQLGEHGITIPIRHIANTAGSSCVNLEGLSMVRLGAGAYGMAPSAISISRSNEKNHHFNHEPILRWHTHITHIRIIPTQQPIGYDRTFTTERPTTIALLPIGYADGYNKRLSNKATVLLQKQQQYAPVIGRVAMNITTIDITSIPQVAIGDEVILVGPEKSISVNHLAELTEGYNPREITVQINNQIPRIIEE